MKDYPCGYRIDATDLPVLAPTPTMGARLRARLRERWAYTYNHGFLTLHWFVVLALILIGMCLGGAWQSRPQVRVVTRTRTVTHQVMVPVLPDGTKTQFDAPDVAGWFGEQKQQTLQVNGKQVHMANIDKDYIAATGNTVNGAGVQKAEYCRLAGVPFYLGFAGSNETNAWQFVNSAVDLLLTYNDESTAVVHLATRKLYTYQSGTYGTPTDTDRLLVGYYDNKAWRTIITYNLPTTDKVIKAVTIQPAYSSLWTYDSGNGHVSAMVFVSDTPLSGTASTVWGTIGTAATYTPTPRRRAPMVARYLESNWHAG